MIVSFSDLRYALRLLSKAPGFTALTVGVMAAGIGLGVYMFALLNIFFYKDLPFKDSDSMVRIFSSVNSGQSWVKTNPLDYQEMKSQVKGLSEIAAFDNISISVVGRDDAERYKGSAVEAGFFEITRTQPVLGRVIKPSDNQAGAAQNSGCYARGLLFSRFLRAVGCLAKRPFPHCAKRCRPRLPYCRPHRRWLFLR